MQKIQVTVKDRRTDKFRLYLEAPPLKSQHHWFAIKSTTGLLYPADTTAGTVPACSIIVASNTTQLVPDRQADNI